MFEFPQDLSECYKVSKSTKLFVHYSPWMEKWINKCFMIQCEFSELLCITQITPVELFLHAVHSSSTLSRWLGGWSFVHEMETMSVYFYWKRIDFYYGMQNKNICPALLITIEWFLPRIWRALLVGILSLPRVPTFVRLATRDYLPAPWDAAIKWWFAKTVDFDSENVKIHI